MNRLRATKHANQSQSHEARINAHQKATRDSQSLTNADKKGVNASSQRKRETREHES